MSKTMKKKKMTITADEQYKMMRHADYEKRREYMGAGWERTTSIHKSKKDYNRKDNKKIDIELDNP